MSAKSSEVASPRVFISYAWTSAEHQRWVVDLATQLQRDGVDVVLDVWDLRPGQDKYSFMEQMIVDDTIQKVLIICNQAYEKKANERAGGVGDETQIITPAVFANARSEKFVPIIAERDANGGACVPAYIKSRIYVDVSSSQVYYEGYEQLVRLIHGAPAFAKPPVGTKPAHLDDKAMTGSTTAPLLRRATDALETDRRSADSLARDYLHALGEVIIALRVQPDGQTALDDLVLEAIKQGKVYRDEFLTLLHGLCRFSSAETVEALLTGFFEQLLDGSYQVDAGVSHGEASDSVRFLLLEIFIYAVAMLLESDKVDALAGLLNDTYVFIRNGAARKDSYTAFYDQIESIERRRKQRLGLNRTSLVADTLKERADHKIVTFAQLQQAELLLLAKACVAKVGWWHPRTLVYRSHHNEEPFDLFIAPESKRRFRKLQAVFGVRDPAELQAKLSDAFSDPRNDRLTFGDGASWPISVRALLNLKGQA
jgi:hypothetical protein